MGSVQVSPEPDMRPSYVQIEEYRSLWITNCTDRGDLASLYPNVLNVIDWLHGVECNQFQFPMLVAMYEGDKVSDITSSSDLELNEHDVATITEWTFQEEKVRIWSEVYSVFLSEHAFIHRIYIVGDESYLVGFLLPKDEETRLAILDFQSRYIKRMWF